MEARTLLSARFPLQENSADRRVSALSSPGSGEVEDLRGNLHGKVHRSGDEAIAMRFFMKSECFASILACKNRHARFQSNADELS